MRHLPVALATQRPLRAVTRLSLRLLLVLLAGCGLFSRTLPPGPLPPPPEPAQAQAPSQPAPPADAGVVVDRVVAVVNQDVITLSELQEAVALFLQQNREKPPSPAEQPELERKILERLVDHQLQVQEALREKIEVSDEEVKEAVEEFVSRSGMDRPQLEAQLRRQGISWEALRRELREQLLVRKVVRRRVHGRISVTNGEVEAYFKENREKFETGLKFRVRHLAILATPPDSDAAWAQARERIEALAAELRAGADFAELARQHSQDPSAKAGGDLGELARGELQPVFEEAILKLQVGEVTPPIRSASGFHLFKLEDREELSPQAEAQIRQQIRELLFRRKYQERLDAWLQELRQRALITLRL